VEVVVVEVVEIPVVLQEEHDDSALLRHPFQLPVVLDGVAFVSWWLWGKMCWSSKKRINAAGWKRVGQSVDS
jgi:hypothetical protein